MCVKQLLASQGLVVDVDPELQALGGVHCLRLRTTVPRKKGVDICSYYGTYRFRLPEKDAYLNCIQITAPGSNKHPKYLMASPRCPAVFANDPTLSKETSHIPPTAAS